MSGITLRVLDGADRGRVFDEVVTPVTIGREEGNTIQLNDERVSRFHVKIQEDKQKLVLTDLESTNGTKVNGEDIQLRILRIGDMISVGRSTLLLGSRNQIAERLAKLQPGLAKNLSGESPSGSAEKLLEIGMKLKEDSDWQSVLHNIDPPKLPRDLSPGQAAQLSEVIEFLHMRIRKLVSSADIEKTAQQVTFDAAQWQFLLDLQSRVAEYLAKIGRSEE